MENSHFFNSGLLDPGAQEFRPNTLFPVAPTQIYYSYPYPSHCDIPAMPTIAYPALPAYVIVDPAPLPMALPPTSNTPSRALLLSSVPTEVSVSMVRRDLEVFGDVRAVEMERVREGIVAVHFYDLRHAQTALVEIQEQHMQHQCRVKHHLDAVMNMNKNGSPYEVGPVSFQFILPPPACGLVAGRAVWAQFLVPGIGGYPESYNQGTLVIFNVPHQLPARCLREIFEEFGCMKELREPPMRLSPRFIEFYDIRDAAWAFAEMNGKEINGRQLLIEYSRPPLGPHKRFPKSCHNNYHSPTFMHSQRKPQQPQPQPHFSGRNSRNPNLSQKTSTCHDVMASLCLNGGEGVEIRSRNDSMKSGATNNSVMMDKGTNMKHVNNNKFGWVKDCQGSFKNEKVDNPRFMINEDSIILSNFSDPRTTVMIKNIPNKYSVKLLLNILDNHCIHCNEHIDHDQPLSSYDFVYLPIDFINKCNVGYGFVNLTSREATLRLYKSFHHQNWEVFNSRKICQVTYARLQGLEALKEHFRSAKFLYDEEMEDYLPVVFSPARDGKILSNPIPITRSPSPALGQIDDKIAINKDYAEEDDDEAGPLRGYSKNSKE